MKYHNTKILPEVEAQPEVRVRITEWDDHDLAPETALMMSVGNAFISRTIGADELLEIAQKAMQARAQLIPLMEEAGARKAASEIWNAMRFGELEYA